jgi:hypothetical protein
MHQQSLEDVIRALENLEKALNELKEEKARSQVEGLKKQFGRVEILAEMREKYSRYTPEQLVAGFGDLRGSQFGIRGNGEYKYLGLWLGNSDNFIIVRDSGGEYVLTTPKIKQMVEEEMANEDNNQR